MEAGLRGREEWSCKGLALFLSFCLSILGTRIPTRRESHRRCSHPLCFPTLDFFTTSPSLRHLRSSRSSASTSCSPLLALQVILAEVPLQPSLGLLSHRQLISLQRQRPLALTCFIYIEAMAFFWTEPAILFSLQSVALGLRNSQTRIAVSYKIPYTLRRLDPKPFLVVVINPFLRSYPLTNSYCNDRFFPSKE